MRKSILLPAIDVFGAPGDIPLNADFDGDGKLDLSLYRPSSGSWFNLGLLSGYTQTQFGGAANDIPLGRTILP